MLYFISIIFWGEENLSMFSSNLFKKTIIMTIIVTLGSYFLPAVIKPSVSGYSVLSGTVSADTTSVSDITDGLSNQEKTDVSTTLTESKDIDINTMDVSTQQAFKKIVRNAAESLDLPSEADTIHSNQFGYLIKGSVGAMVKFADPELYLAQVIDQHDKIRNNGWIEAW